MDSKHIERDYSAHRKSVIRPDGEYVKLEIFSFDPQHSKTYLRQDKTLKGGKHCAETSWKSWSCFKSDNQSDLMQFDIQYNANEDGEYRVDLWYEKNTFIHDKNNTGKDLIGSIKINDEKAQSVKFDGENNALKKQTLFFDWKIATQNIHIEVPHNCYFYGVSINKVMKFVGDNYYGESLGNEKGNMVLTSATITKSDMTKASELSCTVFYDDAFECKDSPSGFYIDFNDEVNFYVKTDDGTIKRIFGGYVSSILPDSDRTKLTIACADRLIDGEYKYVVDQIRLGGGVSEDKNEYGKDMSKDFDSYPKALRFLCKIRESTLLSNISSNFTVDGEKYHDGFIITYGQKKKIKKIPVTNAQTKTYSNYIMIRNNAMSTRKQVMTLYDAKKYAKKPIDITKYPYMHITYGLGEVKSEYKSKTTEKVDKAETTAGGQKFGKCGQSQDGKYVMGIGQFSSGRGHSGLNYQTIYKRIFKNKCPHCGAKKLVWDTARKDANCVHCGGYHGSKRTWGPIPETEITCGSCCADYDAVTGWEKDSPWKRLTPVTKIATSSKAEQNKLANGEMVAVPETGKEVSSTDIFNAITKIAFKYKYRLGAGSSSYASMKKCGYGDCWAFSELIFEEMKKYGVSVKITEYSSGYAGNHRSVLYKNAKGQWTDFPYREQGWGKRYNNMLNNYPIGRSKHGRLIKEHKGGTIADVKSSTSTKKSQTTTVTHTKGYDKSKPIQGFLRLTYSTEQYWSAKKHKVDIKFTLSSTSATALNTGLALYWVNDSIKKTTLRLENNRTLIDYLQALNPNATGFYLHSIEFVAPQKKATKQDEDIDWYKSDDSTDDNSSCKMKLYQIVFDDNPSVDASDVGSCGKTINNVMQSLVSEAGYYVNMSYGLHRKDDKINFRVNNQSTAQYTATEGDNNNILAWNSISYTPINNMFNMSMQVFKNPNGEYKYIDTRDVKSIMRYGEHCTLKTHNDTMSNREAYFNAMNSDKYSSEQKYTYTVTVPNCPNIRIGDLVRIVANATKLNSVKEVKSLKVSFDYDKIPRIKTEIGLDELAPDIQLKENLRNLKRNTKKDTTEFSSSASPVSDEVYYEWE